MSNAPQLILYYRQIGRFALNALAGAAEGAGARIVFARDRAALRAAIAEAPQPPIVAWSFYSPGFREAAEELEAVRAESGPAIHIAGGPHATAEPLQTLEAGWDLACIGEGEQVVLDMLAAQVCGGDLRIVRGIASLDGGALRKNGKGAPVALDGFAPFAASHGVFGPIEITRGCIYACSFCQTPFVNMARFRHRSPAVVALHARAMRAAGLRDFRFVTPTAMSYGSQDESPNLAAVEELLGEVRAAIGPHARMFFGTFPSEIRPEHVTREALALVRRHCDNRNIIVGGQSGSLRMLERIHRGHGVEDVRRAVRVAVEEGFEPNVDFLFGLPGEDEEDRAATRRFAEELAAAGARIHTHTFMPLPGTPLRAAEAGAVDPATDRSLSRLASQGRAYGQWRRQAEVAQGLAELRET